jgi:hypothetical protein
MQGCYVVILAEDSRGASGKLYLWLGYSHLSTVGYREYEVVGRIRSSEGKGNQQSGEICHIDAATLLIHELKRLASSHLML